jgi:uncharacterized protein
LHHVSRATIHEFEPIQAKGAHVIAAFPSIGLVATIAANFLIERLSLHQVGMMDGPDFPTLSVVQNGEPLAPVRIYTGTYMSRGRKQRIVVFLSEFQPNPELVRPVAEAILEWCRDGGATAVVSPEGLVVEGEAATDNIVEVYAIGSTKRARATLEKAGVSLFTEGIVAGVTGVLLNMGKRDGFDVIGILSEARKEYPDARSAATVIDVLSQIVSADVSAADLYKEADDFERHIAETLRRRRLQEEALDNAPRQSVMYG